MEGEADDELEVEAEADVELEMESEADVEVGFELERDVVFVHSLERSQRGRKVRIQLERDQKEEHRRKEELGFRWGR